MTQLTLPSRTKSSPDARFNATESDTEERVSLARQIAGLFSRRRQANRIRAWMEVNPAPAVEAYMPKHAGEPQDETTMPELTEEPQHSAGKHMAELPDVETAKQQFLAQDGQPIVGRHAAEVPVDFVQPVPGKHRAPQ